MRTRSGAATKSRNQKRERLHFAEIAEISRLRTERTLRPNRRGSRTQNRSIRAAIDAAVPEYDELACGEVGIVARTARRLLALLLLPLVWLTVWTFFSQFSSVTVERGMWQRHEFWYFSIGVVLMIGWFWSGMFSRRFLYLYVLGHELTHALFVLMHFGRVSKVHATCEGGYIITNKTNWLIALSPYFVPFWSGVATLVFLAARHGFEIPRYWDLVFFAIIGLTWTFHFLWTLWMLPRDQPDLRENGTALSLVLITLANVAVLVGMLCVASDAPMATLRSFGNEWVRVGAVAVDQIWTFGSGWVAEQRRALLL